VLPNPSGGEGAAAQDAPLLVEFVERRAWLTGPFSFRGDSLGVFTDEWSSEVSLSLSFSLSF
jgi:hypothetical protein